MRIVDYPAPVPALASTAMLAVWQAGAQCAVSIDALATLMNPVLGPLNAIPAYASEDIAMGAFVNVYDNSGVITVRNANASNPAMFANAFALLEIDLNETGLVTFYGVNSSPALPSTVSEVWLSDATPGGFVTTPPSNAGSIVQPLGMLIPGYGIIFTPQARIQL